MRIPLNPCETEIEIKRSRFLVRLEPVTTPDEAKSAVKERWREHPQATHVVWAFRTGPGGEIMGMSDDREPAGTAGRPTLEVLKGSGLTNCLITTVRYFGGTKLGTGGLVRAYTESAQAALPLVESEELIQRLKFSVVMEYTHYEPVKSLLNELGATECNEEFTDRVSITGLLPETNKEKASALIIDLTSGRAQVS